MGGASWSLIHPGRRTGLASPLGRHEIFCLFLGLRKFTHLDFRVGPPQKYTWGRSPIAVSLGGDWGSFGRCALPNPGGGKVPLSHWTKASLETEDTFLKTSMVTGYICTRVFNKAGGWRVRKRNIYIFKIKSNKLSAAGPGAAVLLLPEEHRCPRHHRSITLFTGYC